MEYEIDVTDVEAGTTVDQSECERILGIKRKGNEYNYQFALMQLAEFIQRSLWKIGKQFTVTTSAGQVNILTHEEASKYNESRFDLAISKMRRCNRRLNAVDIGSLSKDSRVLLEQHHFTSNMLGNIVGIMLHREGWVI
jgi:hypothetical protein